MGNVLRSTQQLMMWWAVFVWLFAMPFDPWQRSATLMLFLGVAQIQRSGVCSSVYESGVLVFHRSCRIGMLSVLAPGWGARRRQRRLQELSLKELRERLEERESFLAIAMFIDQFCDRTSDPDILQVIPPVNGPALRAVQRDISEIRREIRRHTRLGVYRDSSSHVSF